MFAEDFTVCSIMYSCLINSRGLQSPDHAKPYQSDIIIGVLHDLLFSDCKPFALSNPSIFKILWKGRKVHAVPQAHLALVVMVVSVVAISSPATRCSNFT